MKSEHVGTLIGAALALIGGIMAVKGGGQKPPQFALVIIEMIIAFAGKYIAEQSKN